MAVDSHKAHILESRKKVMFATAFGKGTSLLEVTRSSTIVARAPCFQEVANINYELLHEAVGGHYSINTLSARILEQSNSPQRPPCVRCRNDRINKNIEHHLLDCVMVDIAAA